MTNEEHIKSILEDLIRCFAYKDDEGNWWGHDTSLGDCNEEIKIAINKIIIRYCTKCGEQVDHDFEWEDKCNMCDSMLVRSKE